MSDHSKEYVAFAVSRKGEGEQSLIKGHCPIDMEEIFWLKASDDQGLILTIDDDFNMIWYGDEQEAKNRLRKIFVIEKVDPPMTLGDNDASSNSS